MPAVTEETQARRDELLDAAAQVFLRYGFKKTSMDEVARAAQVSRPGLYLHFDNKEELFRETVRRILAQALTNARATFLDRKLSFEERMVQGFAALHGHTIGSGASAQHMNELFISAQQLAGEIVAGYERTFRSDLVRAVESAAGKDLQLPHDVTPAELADLLATLSLGLKHQTTSLPEYTKRLGRGIRVLLKTALQ